ncbi:MAG TPA: thermonuclease family protein [Candidatus Cloacimonas sp.]|nr:thermonuclease family protein [Candidatus Cloacimonas sp.]
MAAKTLSGRVIKIKDGDTIVVLSGNRQITIRLEGIDCPESQQAFGNKAKQFTAREVYGKNVKVHYVAKDRYQRILGTVQYARQKELNLELLKAGLAWHYKHYNSSKLYARTEYEARLNKIGLWNHKNPLPPWEFRRKD